MSKCALHMLHALFPYLPEIYNNAHHYIKESETSCLRNCLKLWFNLVFIRRFTTTPNPLFPQVESQIGVGK